MEQDKSPEVDPRALAKARGKTHVEPPPISTKAGGVYIPPARLRQMQGDIKDKESEAYQRMTWEALKKSIHGFVNKVNVGNIAMLIPGE